MIRCSISGMMTQSAQLTIGGDGFEGTSPAPKSPTRSAKRANSLDGREWERYSISIWSDVKKTPEEKRLGHPAMFPLALAIRLIRCFTPDGESVVLDPFAGVGATPIAAEMLGKTGVGVELNDEFAAKARSRETPLSGLADFTPAASLDDSGTPTAAVPRLGKRVIHSDDANMLLLHVAPSTVDFVLTSPPYWDILLQDRSADGKAIRHYGEEEKDLGKIPDYDVFIKALGKVFHQVFVAMKPGAYCVVVVMDIRKKSRFYPFHSDVAAMMEELGFIYDDVIIWDRRHEYNNMRPLGYPSKFRINKAHEFLLIFQKPEEAR